MTEVAKHLTVWTRDLFKTVLEISQAQGQQLAAWLVVGNAGAMVVSFNAVIQGSTCNHALMQASATSFAGGLGLAFSGAVVSYAGNVRNLMFIGRLNNAAEKVFLTDSIARETDAADDDDFAAKAEAWREVEKASLELAAVKPRYLYVAPIVAIVLFLGSVLAFGVGILSPITRSEAAFASCSAKARPVQAGYESPKTLPKPPAKAPQEAAK